MANSSNINPENQSAEHAEDWFESTGKPSRDALYRLAESGTPEDWETLHNLAAKYNVNNYDNPANMIELADKIAQAIDEQDSSGAL
jgi:hypothetical protein